MTFLATGFQKVDYSTDHEKLIRCLNAIHDHPFFQSVKEESFHHLDITPGFTILEIGCGTGQDANSLAILNGPKGNVIGSDISYTVLSRAKMLHCSSNVSFCLMDGHNIPIIDNACDAVREDRVLQHVHHPEYIIKEIFRILKPGGRCVLFEPDWDSFLVDGGDFDKTRKILDFWSDQFACGHIGGKLRRFCMNTGFSDIVVIPKTCVFTDLAQADLIFTLSENARMASEKGIIVPEEANEFIRILMDMDKNGTFFCSFTGYLVSGKKEEDNI